MIKNKRFKIKQALWGVEFLFDDNVVFIIINKIATNKTNKDWEIDAYKDNTNKLQQVTLQYCYVTLCGIEQSASTTSYKHDI